MKILSIENKKNFIDFELKKDILIPCWIYKIPIKTKKGKQLNFIEKTILELIKVDNRLKDDIDKLSEILGFCKRDENGKIYKEGDKREIIKLMLIKIKQLKQENELDDEKNIDINIYQFYQEVYTNELLPLITQDINDFSFTENNKIYIDKKRNTIDNFYRLIDFKQDISSSKTCAVLVDDFNKNKFVSPTQADLIKAIHLHNKNQYKGSHFINYTDVNIDITEPELIYLHTKLYIPKINIESIIITNGFSNDYSTLLRNVFTNKYKELIKRFREEIQSDTDKLKENITNIPFENKIKKYPDIVSKIRVIENNITILQNKSSNSKEIKNAKLIAQNYYDICEELFKVLSEDVKDDYIIKKKSPLQELAKDIGFKLNKKKAFKIFNVSSVDNLQKYLAKSIILKKDELFELSSSFPQLLFVLDKLFVYRNGLKHSAREETLKKIDEKELLEYKDMIYKMLSIILRVKQKVINNSEFVSDESHRYNAYIAIENELGIDIMNKLPQEIKDNLETINFYLYENDFEINKYQIVENVINLLYSCLEFIIKKLINTLYLIDTKKIISKEKILEVVESKVTLSSTLATVRVSMIDQVLKNTGGSLGAYMLVYLYFKDMPTQNEVDLVQEVLTLRGHGNPSKEDVLKIRREKLENLKTDSFKYIKKLIEEI